LGQQAAAAERERDGMASASNVTDLLLSSNDDHCTHDGDHRPQSGAAKKRKKNTVMVCYTGHMSQDLEEEEAAALAHDHR